MFDFDRNDKFRSSEDRGRSRQRDSHTKSNFDHAKNNGKYPQSNFQPNTNRGFQSGHNSERTNFQTFQDNRQNSRSNSRGRDGNPQIICHRCNNPGHKKYQCRKKPCHSCGFENSCQSCNIFCYFCGKKGHKLKFCFSNPNRQVQMRGTWQSRSFDHGGGNFRGQQYGEKYSNQQNENRNRSRNRSAEQQDIHLPAATAFLDQRIIPSPPPPLNY